MSKLIPSLETFAKGTFATAAGLSTIAVGLLYYGQNYLIYPSAFPQGSRVKVPVPTDFGLPYDDLILKTPDGINIRAYLLLQKKVVNHGSRVDYSKEESDEEFAARRPTVVMFHGNGGNHGHRIPLAKVFYHKMRCNVIMPSYRGYALSEGSPSEKGIRIDAQTTLEYLTTHPVLSQAPIIIYGQSIGGAVGIDLASRNPTKIRALILENTFTSIPRLIPTALPLLAPFSFLCHQKWDSATRIHLISPETPMLLLSGLHDEVVPKEHMKALWEIITSRAKDSASPSTGKSKFVEFEFGTHNDTCIQPGYWTTIADFVASLRG